MRYTRMWAALCVSAAFALTLDANAGFRCRDGNLVNEGDSVAYLLDKCGDPLYKSDIRDNKGRFLGEQFFYRDRIDPAWLYTVNVVNGKVTKVETGRQ